MESRISPDELARQLGTILNRVRVQGDRYVIVSDGRPIGVLQPAADEGIPATAFLAVLQSAPRPDPGFADELEAVVEQSMKLTLGDTPAWDS